MIKRISWFSPVTIFGAMGLISLLYCVAEAGTYKLEYPTGYGCNCKPNTMNFGVYQTQWRQWPGQTRMDQTHPKAVGAEPLPPVKGYEPLPLPRVKIQDLQPKPESEQPGGGPPVEPGVPGRGLPGGLGLPGGESLPGLQTEPGGINPSPGLPPDLNLPGILDKNEKPSTELPKDTPSPLEKKDDLEKNDNLPTDQPKDTKDEAKPGVGSLKFKSDSPRKTVSPQPAFNRHAESSDLKNSVPTRLPETAPSNAAVENTPAGNQTHLQANWNASLQPGMYAETFRSGTLYPSTDMAKQATYQAPVNSNGGSRSNEVVQQSFQQAEAGKIATPPVALKGFCPVELCRGGRWVQGDPRWTVIHQGVTYRLSGNDQRLQFLAHPEQFVPANGGNDLVLSATQQRNIPGDLSYCAAYQGRIYMFSSTETQKEFQQNPERFVHQKDHNAESSNLNQNYSGPQEFETLGRTYNTSRTGY